MAQLSPGMWITFLTLLVLLATGPIHAESRPESHLTADSTWRASNESLLWGPYRPNLYFGVRPRIPKSLLTGLLWARVEDFQTVQTNFRHTCEQHEGMAGYGWDEYDPRTGGRQVIHDAGNMIDITTEFVKIPGGTHGGNWGVRIKGSPRDGASEDLKTTVVFYAGMEGLGSLEIVEEEQSQGFEGTVTIQGQTPESVLGDFRLAVTQDTGGRKNTHPTGTHPSFDHKSLDRTFVRSLQLPDQALWQGKAIFFSQVKEEIDGYTQKYGEENPPPPWQFFTMANNPGVGNFHIIQKVFEGAFEFDVLFSSASAAEPIKSEDLTRQIQAVTSSFSERFRQLLKPQAPFQKDKHEAFSKSMLSNLLGGIGYFHGDAMIDRSYAQEYLEENEGFWEETAEARTRSTPELEGPFELFTSIPSRPFFPRGFLWDEGFHLLPVVDWDINLTLDIVKSWFNLMDDDGWIAREQILGPEARSKVPSEFQVQYPHYANPPTLFFVLDEFVKKFKAFTTNTDSGNQQILSDSTQSTLQMSHEAATQYLRNLYPLLKRHYLWFRKTQRGDIRSYDREAFSTKEAYRWRGRTPRHILPSGLDDYPRPQPPHPGELHVDLMSWMGMMTRALKNVALALGEQDDATEFSGYETGILRNLDDLHWSDRDKCFCDATIDEYEENSLVCHKGYISIFPFMMGLLPPDSPRLGAILDLISDPNELWSEHGVRSLSQKDEFYGIDENYWRSPVWMNMNYLILRELLNLAQAAGPHQARAQKMYTQLRKNLVDTVYRSWEKTGFAWEQYNPETGEGQRTQHFTGWTSLVVKMMSMPDLSGGAKVRDEL